MGRVLARVKFCVKKITSAGLKTSDRLQLARTDGVSADDVPQQDSISFRSKEEGGERQSRKGVLR